MANKERQNKINEFLTRGAEQVIDPVNLRRRLLSGEPLRVKYGIDPTSPDIHIGRMVPILKVRDLQELGCTPVIIIGDQTGVIGDTSDKNAERPMLSSQTVRKNMTDYLRQISMVINIEGSEVHYNSEWLKDLNLQTIFEVMDVFSVHDFVSRSKIKDRLASGSRVSLRETLYPILQGYDSFKVLSDVELGGSDQWFNLLTGRAIQKHYNQPPQDIYTTELLMGLDGRKMSSSWGNTVSINDTPENIFVRLMSIPDNLIYSYMVNVSRIPMSEVDSIVKQMQSGRMNPRDAKTRLSSEVVSILFGKNTANLTREKFVNVYQNRNLPGDSEIPIVVSPSGNILDLLVSSGLVRSKNEAKTLISQKGIRVNGEIIGDLNTTLPKGTLVQKGKHSYFRVG